MTFNQQISGGTEDIRLFTPITVREKVAGAGHSVRPVPLRTRNLVLLSAVEAGRAAWFWEAAVMAGLGLLAGWTIAIAFWS